MARVVALIPDLLFGSRVLSDLLSAGHQVELVSAVEQACSRLAGADVLIVDLTDERLQGAELAERLGEGVRPRTLAFHSHVDIATRERAEEAGFDLIVPRSRMAREGAALATRLAGE
jgi:CheY-like chemotaxis protein